MAKVRPHLAKTPSKMTNKELVLLMNEKIEIMKTALDRIQADADNLEYAVKIQEVENDLDIMVAKNEDKTVYTEKIVEKSKLLNIEKDRVLREINEKKRIIRNQPPEQVLNTALKHLEQKTVFTTFERDNFITHLNEEKLKLTDNQDVTDVEEKINVLLKKFDEILNDLQNNTNTLKNKKDPNDMIDFALSKYNQSVEALHKQHERALSNLDKRCNGVLSQMKNEPIPPGKLNPKARRLTAEILKVEENIDRLRALKDEAIETLEQQKREIRRESDPDYKSDTEVDKNIKELEEQTEDILQLLGTKHQDVKKKKMSIDALDTAITQMERDLSRIQHEHDKALLELEQKKVILQERLSSIEKLDLLINILTYKIYEAQHDYRKDMEELMRQREELLARTDLTESQLALALAELDKKIADRKNMHEQAMLSLQGQKDELEKESFLKMKNMDENLDELKNRHLALLAELEAQKLNATPSELELINQKIAELNAQFEEDMEELRRLQSLGWRDINSEERLAALLEARGLRVTKSGRLLTASGRLLTLEEAECLGLLDGIEASWDTLLRGPLKHEDEPSIASQESSDASSVFSRMTSEDVHYLKETLGKPLTLALAEITAKQPRDPIHYLGHWLFKYRYNQELDVINTQEVKELTEERDRIARERWHQMIQEEARQVVLEMIIRAEEEAMRNEIEREMRRIAAEAAMQEEENDELAAEARDILGTYMGPPAGQRSSLTRA